MQAEPDSNRPRRRPPYGIKAFTGREWDPATGLYYYRARYYDPKVGRFISEDPLGLSAGFNGYVYAANNPIRWIDPLGYDYITYSPAAKVLQWRTDDGTVVVSIPNVATGVYGPKNRGPLPHGHYKGYELVRTWEAGMVCPKAPHGWKLRLDPQFDSTPHHGADPDLPRDGLLIHADGGTPDLTKGCIGVPCGSDADTLEMLLDMWFGAMHSTIDVFVGGAPAPFPVP